MLDVNFIAALRSFAPRLVLWVDMAIIKRGVAGGVSESSTFLASSQPGFFLEATVGKAFRFFADAMDGSLRIKRSAAAFISSQAGAKKVVRTYGSLTFPNHDKRLDAKFGAQGYSTDGQAIEAGVQVIPSPYGGNLLGPRSSTFWQGICEERQINDDVLTVTVVNELSKLDTLLVTTKITIALFPNAPPSSLGRSMPWMLGHCHSVELIPVDPLNQGGEFLIGEFGCSSGEFFRDGQLMTRGVDYTEDLGGGLGYSSIVLLNALQNARITAHIQGLKPAHLASYSDQLTEVGLHLLISAGLPLNTFKASELTNCRALFPWSVDFPVFEETKAIDLWEELNDGIPITLDQAADTVNILAPWTEPSGTAEIELEDDVHIFKHDMSETPLIKSVLIRYAPYSTTLSGADVAGALNDDDPDQVARLAQDFLEFSQEIIDADPELPTATYTSRLNDLADVETLAQMGLDLFGTPHLTHTLSLDAIGVSIEGISSVISLLRDRLGLATGGPLVRVFDIETEWDSAGASVKVLAWEKKRGT